VSGQHWLVVREWDPEDPDVMDVEHPDDCPRVDLGEGGWEYGCAFEFYIGEYGYSQYFVHVDDEDAFGYEYTDKIAPGRHAIEYWDVRHPAGPWGGAEWDAGIRLAE